MWYSVYNIYHCAISSVVTVAMRKIFMISNDRSHQRRDGKVANVGQWRMWYSVYHIYHCTISSVVTAAVRRIILISNDNSLKINAHQTTCAVELATAKLAIQIDMDSHLFAQQ